MQFSIPEVRETLEILIKVDSTFNKTTKSISEWLSEHRAKMVEKLRLVEDGKDIQVLNIFLGDFLVRAIRGEMGSKIHESLEEKLKCRKDLQETTYRNIITAANYRWGVDIGVKVISDVVNCVASDLHWDWRKYINDAESNRERNYPDDPILRIKYIKFKLRDLALSNFSPYYAAFDLHVTRVLTRLGWLNYGWDYLGDVQLEMGNNPGNQKNYLFLHKLFFSLSEKTDGKYRPADLDRIFWHFGKSQCGAKPNCGNCAIKANCPTGKYR